MTQPCKTLYSTIGILCLVGGLAGGAVAEVSPASTGETAAGVAPRQAVAYNGAQIVTGTVASSTSTELVITEPDGRRLSFALNPAGPYEAAMMPGDEVRVFYDPMQDGSNRAARVQTLNVTANMSRAQQQRMLLAASLPPTQAPETGGGTLMAQAESDRSGTAATSPPLGIADELPATASPLPAVGGVGALLLAASAGAGLIRRRISHTSSRRR